ncbi:MAG TPA: hypothetical protein PLE45_12085 [Spirochaetota bacterium]|mgnify:CR=1 FL=1|nr:hypothetical protein [Spirochaetota bacterium]HOL56991.1 hypothetical protein [Spirochaetota bacterium]HPP05525.1 hypothetical protein [Spirochaetota bacterium]
MKNRFFLIFIFLLIAGFNSLFSEDSIPIDKYDTKNIMLSSIIYTKLGLILVYYVDDIAKEAYVPFEFFRDGRAKQVIEDDIMVTPQANIIYKNGKPFKVKIYVPTKTRGTAYKLMDAMPEDIKEKFKNTTDLYFEYK